MHALFMLEVNLVTGLKTSSSENIFGCYKKINLINYANLLGLLNQENIQRQTKKTLLY